MRSYHLLNNYDLQNIEEFIDYLDTWAADTRQNNLEFSLESTYIGLHISLRATLEICEYLVEKCKFDYLMTARLNQDSLEVNN